MADAIYELWTDGSCNGHKVGGWAAVVKLPDSPFVEEMSGAERDTTSQRMEMTALLHGLRRFQFSVNLIVHTDSAYVMNCFERKWMATWRRNGWISSRGQPVKNRDLWEQLEVEVERHLSVRFIKVKGHAGHQYNELADKLAGEAVQNLIESSQGFHRNWR